MTPASITNRFLFVLRPYQTILIAVLCLSKTEGLYAEWPSTGWRAYTLGLFDEDQGARTMSAIQYANSGVVSGYSSRYSATGWKGSDVWAWTPSAGITRLGLTGPEYVSPSGDRDHRIFGFFNDGSLVGWTRKYQSTTYFDAPWFWSPISGTTILQYIEDSTTPSLTRSHVSGFTDSGSAIGYSYRYQGTQWKGLLAWVWSRQTGYTRLGETDSRHTNNFGEQYSEAVGINQSGRITGYSYQYDGYNSKTAWTWSFASGHERIGLPLTVSANGTVGKSNTPLLINQQDLIVGVSDYELDPGAPDSRVMWAWSPEFGTVRIDHAPTPSDPYAFNDDADIPDHYRLSTPLEVNDSGRVVGTTHWKRASASDITLGWTWTHDTGTVRIGLTDAEHTGETGSQGTEVLGLSHNGIVFGHSDRHIEFDDSYRGQSAWVWSQSTNTTPIGFKDAQHTKPYANYQDSEITAWTKTGFCTGYSRLYITQDTGSAIPQITIGRTAWFWSVTSGTVRIGLTDPNHTNSQGLHYSEIYTMNNVGQVIGFTSRVNNTDFIEKRDAWFYDPVENITVQINPIEGPAGSTPYVIFTQLTQSGWVVGIMNYYLNDVYVGYLSFLWSKHTGTIDVRSILDSDISLYGLSTLHALRIDDNSQIISCRGEMMDGKRVGVALLIPNPSSFMTLMGIFVLCRRRREKSL